MNCRCLFSVTWMFVPVIAVGFMTTARQSRAADLATVLGEGRAGDVVVEQVNDLDDIVIRVKRQRFSVAMASVVSFADWPAVHDQRVSKLREETLKAVRDLLVDQVRLAQIRDSTNSDSTTLVDLSRAGHHGPREKPWEGKMPSDKVGWFMTSMNILLVEKGYTLYSGKQCDDRPEFMNRLFEDAENLAAKNHAGIWAVPGLVAKLKKQIEIRSRSSRTCRPK